MFEFMDMDFEASAEIKQTDGPYIPEASECMRCGMCVSHCPTFRLFQIDEETPRKRIRTLGKLLVENQPVGADEREHLENCLQCRACETICPSRMAYGSLFDQAKAQLKIEPKGLAKLAFKLIENKRLRLKLMPWLAFYLNSGLRSIAQKSGLFQKLGLADAEALLRQVASQPLKEIYPTRKPKRGKVALFTGCIAEHLDQDTLKASIKLLEAIGYEVQVPPQQACCGAIHQHNGQPANALIEHNIQLFNELDVEAVLHAATGCGAMLSEYGCKDSEAAQLFQKRLCDIHDFLLARWPEDLKLLPSSLKVAVHEPCSQRNVLKNQQTVYALLQKIPDLNIAPLADNTICCGAGGNYLLTHPENAKKLRALKHQAIDASQADRIISSNFGCKLFLDTDSNKVQHPLSLLARQLPLP